VMASPAVKMNIAAAKRRRFVDRQRDKLSPKRQRVASA
jgi:hypothetical protein